MSHARLAQLMQAHQAALDMQPEAWATQEAMVGVLQALAQGEITQAQALRLLGFQATRLADEPSLAALSRQAAAEVQRVQREEHRQA